MLISALTHGQKQTQRSGPGQRRHKTLPSELVLEMHIYGLTSAGVTSMWEESL